VGEHHASKGVSAANASAPCGRCLVRGASCLVAKREQVRGSSWCFVLGWAERQKTESGGFNTKIAVRLRQDHGATR
jgi:hypothetical protein